MKKQTKPVDDDDAFDDLYLPEEEVEAAKNKKTKNKGKGLASEQEPIDLTILTEEIQENEEEEDDDDDFNPNAEEDEDEDDEYKPALDEEVGILFGDGNTTSSVKQTSSNAFSDTETSTGSSAVTLSSTSSSSTSTASSVSIPSATSSTASSTPQKRKIENVDDFFNEMQQQFSPAKKLKTSANGSSSSSTSSTPVISKNETKKPATQSSAEYKPVNTDNVDDFFLEMHKQSLAPSSSGSILKQSNATTTESDSMNEPQEKPDRLAAVIEKMQKKKETTIRKSKEDWERYKVEKGLEEELVHATKDGYLEKQAFLDRTEMRQWERDRDLRNQERERQRWAQQQNK